MSDPTPIIKNEKARAIINRVGAVGIVASIAAYLISGGSVATAGEIVTMTGSIVAAIVLIIGSILKK